MPGGRSAVAALAVAGALLAPAAPPSPADSAVPDDPGVHSTSAARALRPQSGPGPSFAIVAYDSASGSWGVACAAPSVACGAQIPGAVAAAGAVAVLGAPSADIRGAALAALGRGEDPAAAVEAALRLLDDPESRQIALIGPAGRTAAVTGRRVRGWSGERRGAGYACVAQGLDGGEPLQAMASRFEAEAGDLSSRLLAALVATGRTIDPENAFEESEGAASAALLVVRSGVDGAPDGSDRLVDLRVDAAPDPLSALERLYDRYEGTYLAAAHVRSGDRAKRAGDDAGARREYRLAESGFRAALGRRPKDPDALNELAWFLATRGGDAAEALRYAEAAVQGRGDDPNLYDTLAEAAYRAGDLERAIGAAERAARLARGNARYAERLRAFEAAKAALTNGSRAAPGDSTGGSAPRR